MRLSIDIKEVQLKNCTNFQTQNKYDCKCKDCDSLKK